MTTWETEKRWVVDSLFLLVLQSGGYSYFFSRLTLCHISFLKSLYGQENLNGGTAFSGDPDSLTDFIAPPNATVDGSFFTFTGFGFLVNGTQLPADKFKVVKATMAEFPALNCQSVSYATLLFPNTLQVGDMFVFPKGLVHFQYNAGTSYAIALSAFGSASAGTVSLPGTLFATGIDDAVLAKSFKTDVGVIQKLKAGLAVKP
ncbi:unnamed protein product [Linum tenue]|uniref:Germin-like protein n=1 Tax=Linum tenue TaxID=586396 RepID=A0AAV0J205_9ROSI|nr:unnamed protein product [Linum tenue]